MNRDAPTGPTDYRQVLLCAGRLVYNLCIHLLHHFPGPWYCRASSFWYCSRVWQGTLPFEVKRLHDEFGDSVRIAPNELSYNKSKDWQSIYGIKPFREHMLCNCSLKTCRNKSESGQLMYSFAKNPSFYRAALDQKKTWYNCISQAMFNQLTSLVQWKWQGI